MGHWRKGSAILALIVLPPVGFPQRVAPHVEPHLEPRVEPRVDPLRRGERLSPDGRALPLVGFGIPRALVPLLKRACSAREERGRPCNGCTTLPPREIGFGSGNYRTESVSLKQNL